MEQTICGGELGLFSVRPQPLPVITKTVTVWIIGEMKLRSTGQSEDHKVGHSFQWRPRSLKVMMKK